MRVAALAFLLVGCQISGGGDLWPDEFHLWASYGDSDVSGSSRREQGDPWRTNSSGDIETTTIGGGLTWYLNAARGRDPELIRAIIRLASEWERMRAPVATLEVPVRVAVLPQVVAPAAAPPSVPPIPEPGHEDTQEPDDETEDDELEGVKLEGVSEDVWVRLIGALALLLTALAGYLGRQRIPVVRDWTSEGRARRRVDEGEEGG